MNAGMYGLADGKGMAGRKLIGRAGQGALPVSTAGSTLAASVGASYGTISLTSGVKTRVLGVSGSGALRFGFVENGSAFNTSSSIQVVVDGVVVTNQSLTSPSWSIGNALIFCGSSSGGVLDYLPFSQSLEVFVTAGATSSSFAMAYLADLYQ